MFITNKKVELPSEIEVDGNLVKTVDNYKLFQFVHGIKVNCNAPIKLKQILESLTPIADQEIPSKIPMT